MTKSTDLIVITGLGGMGVACAHRLGAGRRLLLADIDESVLRSAAGSLSEAGFDVSTQRVDVSDHASIEALVRKATESGTLRTLVHTAGISPTMADARRIYEVDLVGTALLIEAFLPLAAPGTVAIVIASMAGYHAGLDVRQEQDLALAPCAELTTIVDGLTDDPRRAYYIAKRANQLRVESASVPWGARGARIVSISPGIIATPMSRQEIREQPVMKDLLALSPVQRWGAPEDIAGAVDWLASSAASFISGIDLRLDGGVTAAVLRRNRKG